MRHCGGSVMSPHCPKPAIRHDAAMSPSEQPTLGPDAVVAVVVTRHRLELLADSLKSIATQTRPPDHLVVVDNGPDKSARPVVEASGLPCTYLPSHRNLGGAGGF